MSKKLSEAQALEKIARYEKNETRMIYTGVYGLIIGVPGLLISLIIESGLLSLIFGVIFFVGGLCLALKDHMRNKAESLATNQLQDFYKEELERYFGPLRSTKEMDINKQLIEELRPVTEYWNEYSKWRFYEGNYHDTHFSVENVHLKEVIKDGDNSDIIHTKFEGAVMRCKNICDPATDIALCRSGTDHRSTLKDPIVFCQIFSARTADGQSADNLVTPELREMIQKIESFSTKYTMTAMMIRNGEVILAIKGYCFGDSYSGEESLQDFDRIRSHFTDSLLPLCKLIDILQNYGGKL